MQRRYSAGNSYYRNLVNFESGNLNMKFTMCMCHYISLYYINKGSFFTLDRNAVHAVWFIVQCSVTDVHGFIVFLLAAFQGKLYLFQVPFQVKNFVMASLTPFPVIPLGQPPRSCCASWMSVSTSGMALAQVASRSLPSAQPQSF